MEQEKLETEAYQLIDGQGQHHDAAIALAHPPTLVSLTTFTSSSSLSTSAPQSASQLLAASSTLVSLQCHAVRFVNGRQQMASTELGSDTVLKAVREGLRRHKMTATEALAEVFARFKARDYISGYTHDQAELTIRFEELPRLSITLRFNGKAPSDSIRATPAFATAFKGACSLARSAASAERSAKEATELLQAKDKELRSLDRKLQNAQQELADKGAALNRLLATGGMSLNDVPQNGKGLVSPQRGARTALIEAEESSAHKKRKAAEPTLAKAGRTARQAVSTGFIDSSDSEDEDASGASGSPHPATAASGDKRTRSKDKGQKGTDPSPASSKKSIKKRTSQAEGAEPALKKVKADPSMAGSGRTVHKPVNKGFLDEDSATDPE